jgi:hypothetical protein
MEEAPENGKELSHSARQLNEGILPYINVNDAYTFCMMSSKLWSKIILLTLGIPGSSHYWSSDKKRGSS